jgi:hypothetical protein
VFVYPIGKGCRSVKQISLCRKVCAKSRLVELVVKSEDCHNADLNIPNTAAAGDQVIESGPLLRLISTTVLSTGGRVLLMACREPRTQRVAGVKPCSASRLTRHGRIEWTIEDRPRPVRGWGHQNPKGQCDAHSNTSTERWRIMLLHDEAVKMKE